MSCSLAPLAASSTVSPASSLSDKSAEESTSSLTNFFGRMLVTSLFTFKMSATHLPVPALGHLVQGGLPLPVLGVGVGPSHQEDLGQVQQVGGGGQVQGGESLACKSAP